VLVYYHALSDLQRVLLFHFSGPRNTSWRSL
jgi:hypothetical protein